MEQPPKSFDDNQSSFLTRALRDLEVRLNNVIEVAKNISLSGAIKTANLADGAVTTIKLADSAVTTTKLADGSVTQPKLAANVAGNGPIFSAHHTVANALAAAVYTKVIHNIEDFDTNSNYNNVTGVFTPTVAGYYLINASIQCDTTNTTHLLSIFKNNVIFFIGKYEALNEASGTYTVTGIVNMNGTTDFVDVRCFSGAASNTLVLNGSATLFQGCLIRAA